MRALFVVLNEVKSLIKNLKGPSLPLRATINIPLQKDFKR